MPATPSSTPKQSLSSAQPAYHPRLPPTPAPCLHLFPTIHTRPTWPQLRTFGDTTLDDDGKLSFLQHVKNNEVGTLHDLLMTGDLDRLRNYQNHYGDSALILSAWCVALLF